MPVVPATMPRFGFALHPPKSRHAFSRNPFLAAITVLLLLILILLVRLPSRADLPMSALTESVSALTPDSASPNSASPNSDPTSSSSFDTTVNHTPHYVRADKPLPACANAGRARSFLIVFQSRSGSTAISGELKAHSEVHMNFLEYLDRRGVVMSNSTGAIAETRAFFKEGIAKGLVPGFKIRSYHIIPAPEMWKALVNEFDTRIIWQYRKNVVKSAIGTYQREQLGDETAISGIKRNDAVGDRCAMGVGCKFKIANMKVFHSLLQNRVGYQNQIMRGVSILDADRQCTLEVPYEDYLYYPRQTVTDMQRFLGLKSEKTASDRIKATRDSLCDVVENFDDLCDNFYGCASWQPYFDDFVNNCRCKKFSHGPVEFCDVN